MKGAKFREVLVGAMYALGVARGAFKRAGIKRHSLRYPSQAAPHYIPGVGDRKGEGAVRTWIEQRLTQGGPTPERLRFLGTWRVSCNLAKTLGDKHVLVQPGSLLELLDYVESRSRTDTTKTCVRCGASYAPEGHCSRRPEGCQGGLGESTYFDPRSVTFKPYDIGRKS